MAFRIQSIGNLLAAFLPDVLLKPPYLLDESIPILLVAITEILLLGVVVVEVCWMLVKMWLRRKKRREDARLLQEFQTRFQEIFGQKLERRLEEMRQFYEAVGDIFDGEDGNGEEEEGNDSDGEDSDEVDQELVRTEDGAEDQN